jgi:hypothetical protein
MDFGLIARDSSTGGLQTKPFQALEFTISSGFLQLVQDLS